MATAQVARPGQVARRRDITRPSAGTKRPATTEATNGAVAKKQKTDEPLVRDDEYILRKHKGKAPSLVIHLHTSYFSIVGQEGSFAYSSSMKVLLEHVRQRTIPHTILADLHALGVQFYDGCLIIEIHILRGRESKTEGIKGKSDDSSKFSMHDYNEHVTPSPYAPYPSKGAADSEMARETDMPAPERPQSKSKQQEGAPIMTVVCHPTAQSQHEEIMMLANTPASELRGKKKGSDAVQPPTPHTTVPPTPGGSRGTSTQSEKMALDQSELYNFQSESLLATEPPLYLGVASSFDESQAILDILAHPLHSGKAPSPAERKKTTAEMAADDAKAAESERKMLIMDERVKPAARTAAGVASSENQSAAASLGFSRFKTIEMVRAQQEEKERQKKEEEARLAVEKRQFEEQAQQQQQKQVAAQKQREVYQQQQQLKQRQLAAQQQAEMLRQQQIQHQQRQANMMQAHGHPGQGNMMHNGQQGNFQHPQSAGSPVNRQQTQTPIMNSSPLIQQGGFPMVQNHSQGAAGSPAMPSSASAMQHPNVAMARQASQQNGSRNNTPQMQNTPSMANAMPGGRQLSQTPRMQPHSPAISMPQNTPNMMLQTPNPMQNAQNFTPEQLIMLNNQRQLQQQQQQQQAQLQHQQSQNLAQSHQAPQDFQLSQRLAGLQTLRTQLMNAWQNAQQNGEQEQAMQFRQRLHGIQQQMQQLRMTQVNTQQQRQQMSAGGGGNMMAQQHSQQQHPQQQQMPTPQMHAHPNAQPQLQTPQHHHPQQQMTPHPQDPQQHAQQQALLAQRQQYARAAQQLTHVARQHGGQIPPQVLPSLPPLLQQVYPQWRKQQAQMMATRMQQQQQQQQGGMGGVGDQQMYMQALQGARSQMANQMGMGGMQQGGMQGMQGYGQPQQQQQQQQGNLDASFAAMANALQRPGTGQGMQ